MGRRQTATPLDLFHQSRTLREAVAEAKQIIADAVAAYRPAKLFAGFSGGHDSLVATHLASTHPLFAGAFHANTGIGVEETRQFARDTARRFGWPFFEYRSPVTYRSLVLRFGFPGPAGHGLMYSRLKERAIRLLEREHRPKVCVVCGEPPKGHGGVSVPGKRRKREHDHDYDGVPILLVAGGRQQESVRRMGTAEPHHRDRDRLRTWCNPIVTWSTEERNAYIDARGLPRNPVVGKLCMSGECLCGAFAKPGELVEVARHFPETAAQIRALEEEARAAGVHCVWGTRPPKKCDGGGSEPPADEPGLFSLCWSCGNKYEEAADEASR